MRLLGIALEMSVHLGSYDDMVKLVHITKHFLVIPPFELKSMMKSLAEAVFHTHGFECCKHFIDTFSIELDWNRLLLPALQFQPTIDLVDQNKELDNLLSFVQNFSWEELVRNIKSICTGGLLNLRKFTETANAKHDSCLLGKIFAVIRMIRNRLSEEKEREFTVATPN